MGKHKREESKLRQVIWELMRRNGSYQRAFEKYGHQTNSSEYFEEHWLISQPVNPASRELPKKVVFPATPNVDRRSLIREGNTNDIGQTLKSQLLRSVVQHAKENKSKILLIVASITDEGDYEYIIDRLNDRAKRKRTDGNSKHESRLPSLEMLTEYLDLWDKYVELGKPSRLGGLMKIIYPHLSPDQRSSKLNSTRSKLKRIESLIKKAPFI